MSILHLGTDHSTGFGLLAGRDVNQRRLPADDSLVLAGSRGCIQLLCRWHWGPGGDEVVLQHRDPATLGGLVQVGILHLSKVYFL